MVTYRYDFHVHTSRFSPCARSSPEEMCDRAIKTGLTGIALTEHDLWWPGLEMKRLRRMFPELVIFDGVEISAQDGHFLVFLPDQEERFQIHNASIEVLFRIVHARGGLVIWAHPFRYSKYVPQWLNTVKPDAMETASINMDEETSSFASKIAIERGILSLQNSDAHHVNGLGKFYNELPNRLENNDDLINTLKSYY